jgi:hypothetical protein
LTGDEKYYLKSLNVLNGICNKIKKQNMIGSVGASISQNDDSKTAPTTTSTTVSATTSKVTASILTTTSMPIFAHTQVQQVKSNQQNAIKNSILNASIKFKNI